MGVDLDSLRSIGRNKLESAFACAAADEITALRRALHDAITRPMGVVPDSALPFYDPGLCYAENPSVDGLSELAKREAG